LRFEIFYLHQSVFFSIKSLWKFFIRLLLTVSVLFRFRSFPIPFYVKLFIRLPFFVDIMKILALIFRLNIDRNFKLKIDPKML
jgi:hypothetical protein